MHVIAGLDPADGGPSYTVPRLCQALAMVGAEARLVSVAGADGCAIAPDRDGGRCFPWDWARVPMVRDLRCSSGLARALHELAPKADVIHDHGLWLMPNVDAGRAALLARKPFMVAPRGMLRAGGACLFPSEEACHLGFAPRRSGSPRCVHSCD